MRQFRRNIYALLLTLCSVVTFGQQNIKQAKQPSFTVHGNAGLSFTYYNSNETVYSRPSMAWNVYGNFTARVKEWVIPVNIIANQYSLNAGNGNSKPFIQAGLSPSYRFVRLHIGYRYMPFSPLTFEGQSFRGAGIELNPKHFRFAAFYGKLNKSFNEDTSRNQFRPPQFSRMGYGVKAGIGNALRYVDLIWFHAKDDSSSASFYKGGRKPLPAQENAVLGMAWKYSLTQKANRLIFTGDIALSGITRDLSLGKFRADSSAETSERWMSNFLTYNESTEANYAGQASLLLQVRGYHTNIGYRRIEPGYRSLGTPFLFNDLELISWVNNFSLLKQRLNISTVVSTQHNNLDKNLPTELKTQTGSLNANAVIGTKMNLNVMVAGYQFRNKAGTSPLNPLTRISQNIMQLGVSPSYNFSAGHLLHFIAGNFNYSWLSNENGVLAGNGKTTNLSSSLTYTVSLTNKPYSFTASGLYAGYRQDTSSYNSYGGTLGTSVQFLKNRNLNVQGNIGYYRNFFSGGNAQSNMSYNINISYTERKHAFSLFANYIYTPPNAINDRINKTVLYVVATNNLYGGVNYSYSF